MTAVVTADRVVVSVQVAPDGDLQVTSVPTAFRGFEASLFSAGEFVAGHCVFESNDWEVYDRDDGSTTGLLQIESTGASAVIKRPASPFASSNGGDRVTNTSGTHTLYLSLGAGTLQRILRETSAQFDTFTAADATPSVKDARYWKTAGSTAITRFDDMAAGHFFFVYRGSADIIIRSNGNIATMTGTDITLRSGTPCAVFVEDNGVARQVAGHPTATANGDFSGEVSVGTGASSSVFRQRAATGQTTEHRLEVNGVLRWATGANAGVTWGLDRYNASGVYQDSPISVAAGTGNVTIGATLLTSTAASISGSFSTTGEANFGGQIKSGGVNVLSDVYEGTFTSDGSGGADAFDVGTDFGGVAPDGVYEVYVAEEDGAALIAGFFNVVSGSITIVRETTNAAAQTFGTANGSGTDTVLRVGSSATNTLHYVQARRVANVAPA